MSQFYSSSRISIFFQSATFTIPVPEPRGQKRQKKKFCPKTTHKCTASILENFKINSLPFQSNVNFIVLHFKKSLHHRWPLNDQCRYEKIISHGTKSIFLQKCQQQAEPNKNHEMQALEYWNKNTIHSKLLINNTNTRPSKDNNNQISLTGIFGVGFFLIFEPWQKVIAVVNENYKQNKQQPLEKEQQTGKFSPSQALICHVRAAKQIFKSSKCKWDFQAYMLIFVSILYPYDLTAARTIRPYGGNAQEEILIWIFLANQNPQMRRPMSVRQPRSQAIVINFFICHFFTILLKQKRQKHTEDF